MKENNQNHTLYDQRGRAYAHTENLVAKARQVHIDDAATLRNTLSRTCGAYILGSLVNNKLNNKLNRVNDNSKPFPLMGTETDTQPKNDYIEMNIKHKVPNLKSKPNDFWYKGEKYSLTASEYELAESIYQFMFQNGETPWN